MPNSELSNGMKASGVGKAIVAAFAVLPFFSLAGVAYGDVTSKYLFLVLVADLLALFAAYEWVTGKRTFSIGKRWLLGSLGILAIAFLASTILGIYPARSLWSDIFWSSGVVFLVHIAVIAVLLSEYLNKKDWSLLRTVIAVSAGVLGFLALLGSYGFGVFEKFLWIPLTTSGLSLGNETYLGAYLFIGFVFGLVELFKAERTRRSVLIASLVAIALSPTLLNFGLVSGAAYPEVFTNPASVLGGARASSAALFLLIAFAIVYIGSNTFLSEKGRVIAVRALRALLVAFVAGVSLLLLTPGSFLQQAYIEESTAARPIAWSVSMEAFAERPFFGWGPENADQAVERHFDSRLFQDDNLGEIWFERAHNVFIDTLVQLGVVGMLAFALLIALYYFALVRARRSGRIEEAEFMLLTALVPLHLLQTLTGFDTVASYALLAVALGYALSLEREEAVGERALSPAVMKGAGIALTVLALISLKVAWLDEYARINAVLSTFRATTSAEQRALIATSLSRPESFEALRLSYSSFVKGALADYAKAPTPAGAAQIITYAKTYETHFIETLEAQPDDYRARLNYAYLLLIMTGLGENRLADAKALIAGSYELSPGHPLTYVLDSIAELYSGNLSEADRLMQEAIAINPNVVFTKEAAAYLERQKKTFPSISVLKIENL